MEISNKIARDQVFFLIMAAIGLIALFMGFILHIEKDIMLGISCGFLPTGIGGWYIYSRARQNQHMQRNIEIEMDERNQFIGLKAGYTSFWIVYWYVFLVTLLAKYITLPLWKMGAFTLFFMALVFFLFRFIYNRQY